MKLRKKVKRNIMIVIAIILLCIAAIAIYHFVLSKNNTVKEVKVLNEIREYGYSLKDNKTKKYQNMFKELKAILTKDEVDEEKYVSKISEMFIYDFYSLDDKSAKTDVGGTDFLYPSVVTNFLSNAEGTYYKYVESNLYNQRNQKLPIVDKITIDKVEQTSYEYEDKTDDEAYQVEVSWTYTTDNYDDYQNKATLIFVHEDKKLSLVELS